MKKLHGLNVLGLVILMVSRIEARAAPDKQDEILGVNIGGLHADLKTNLFARDGPLAQFGNEISSGANELENELNSGAKALQNDLNEAKNFLSQGSQEEIAGVNVAGLHAGLKTNLFSKTGPLAIVGDDLLKGEAKLENDLTKGADALGASLTDAAKAFQSELDSGANALTSGFQNLGQQISSASGGLSLDGLFRGGLFSPSNDEGSKMNPMELTETITGEDNGQPQNTNRELQSFIRVNLAKHSRAPEQNQLSGNALLSVQGANSNPGSNSLDMNMQWSGKGSPQTQKAGNSVLTVQGANSNQPSSGNSTSNIQTSGQGSGQKQNSITRVRRLFLKSQGANGSQNPSGTSTVSIQGSGQGSGQGKNSVSSQTRGALLRNQGVNSSQNPSGTSTNTISLDAQAAGYNPIDLAEIYKRLPQMCGNV